MKQERTPEFRDPVCGAVLTSATVEATSESGDSTHYFCCQECKEEFEGSPDKYIEEEKITSFR